MKNLRSPEINRYRATAMELQFAGRRGNESAGCFIVPSPTDRQDLRVIAASGEGWEHVSVSRSSRCPNWPEMEHVKRLFFHDDEVCMQLHVATAEHISFHPYCLHIWRPIDGSEIPLPPAWMVGPSTARSA